MGDIQRDTGHLSCAEMGVYDRFLDHYYAIESALPNDVDACCRIARAMTKEERKAVSSILSQFFRLVDGVYEQGRAEKEILDAQPKMVSARLNGIKGGRPKKDKNKTQEKPNGFSENNLSETQHETSPEPEPYIKPSKSVEDSELVEETIKPKTHTQKITSEIIDGLRGIGMMPFNPTLDKFTALIEAGATVDEFVHTALEQRGTDKFNISYLLATMTKRRQAAAVSLHKGAMPQKSDRDAGRQTAAKSIFKPEHTQHLMGGNQQEIEVNDAKAITA